MLLGSSDVLKKELQILILSLKDINFLKKVNKNQID